MANENYYKKLTRAQWEFYDREETRVENFLKKNPTIKQILARVKKIAQGKTWRSAAKWQALQRALADSENPSHRRMWFRMLSVNLKKGYMDYREGNMVGGREFLVNKETLRSFLNSLNNATNARAAKKARDVAERAKIAAEKAGIAAVQAASRADKAKRKAKDLAEKARRVAEKVL